MKFSTISIVVLGALVGSFVGSELAACYSRLRGIRK